MRFELVPNEILLDLFDYLNGIDLLRAFYGLNFRFNLLLYKQYRSFRFQFNNISKHDFDMVCQQHLPYIADKVMTIELSNYRETPEEINLFLCYIPSFKIFIYLQSLTISHLQSYGILLKLLDEFQHLINLMHLCFYACSFSVSSPNSQMIIDKIWSLPKLTHCNINLSINGQRIMCLPTIISVSLRSVRLCNSGLQWNQINQMIGYTPHLKYLMAYIRSFPTKNDIQCSLSALTKCKLCVTDMSDVSSTSIWFPPMTNLRCLEIDLWSGLITGDQWENIIRNYTPQLKVFRLRMEASFYSDLHIKQKADELFDSFRTPFWLDERKWFVRCLTKNETIYLYTRLHTSPSYVDKPIESWRSTCVDDTQQQYYNNITSVYNEEFFDLYVLSDIRLPNIDYLHIELPINKQFWSVVPNLDRLRSVSVSNYSHTFISQLQRLLKQASGLVLLSIDQDASLPLQMSLFTHTNASLRELDLGEYNYCFNEEECFELTRSSVGIQCEVLVINVINSESILFLVKNMTNLRSLTVTCADDKYQKQLYLGQYDDKLVQWLKEHLSATCWLIRNKSNISIWI